MTLDDRTIVADPIPDERQRALALLLEDPEWVAMRFSAIMEGSGLDDRVLTGTFPRPPRQHARWDNGVRARPRTAGPCRRSRTRSRVRSPPEAGPTSA